MLDSRGAVSSGSADARADVDAMEEFEDMSVRRMIDRYHRLSFIRMTLRCSTANFAGQSRIGDRRDRRALLRAAA
jgi:hypothetical protein